MVPARALAVESELIVADQPISSLDASIRAEILELLKNLVQNSDMGILYITHDLLSARMLSDEVIVLNQGKVVEQGPSLQVIRKPQDAYTRTLLEAVPNPFDNQPPPRDAHRDGHPDAPLGPHQDAPTAYRKPGDSMAG